MRRLIHQGGFSLAGALVAMGIFGVLVAAIMGMSQHMIQMLQSSETRAQVQEEMMILQMALSNEKNCTANFKDFKVENASKKFSVNRGVLRLTENPNSYVLSDQYVIPSQDPQNRSSKLNVRELALRKYQGSSEIALLEIDFQAKGSLLGGDLRRRQVPLSIELGSDGEILRCSAMVAGGGANQEENPQGRGCTGKPPGSIFNSSEFDDAIKAACDQQDYPVADSGMKIDLVKSNCHGPFTTTRFCSALRTLWASESGDSDSSALTGGYRNPASLRTRRGFQSPEDCMKQFAFSEGNIFVRRTGSRRYGETVHTTVCVNGQWVETAQVPQPIEENEEVGEGANNR